RWFAVSGRDASSVRRWSAGNAGVRTRKRWATPHSIAAMSFRTMSPRGLGLLLRDTELEHRAGQRRIFTSCLIERGCADVASSCERGQEVLIQQGVGRAAATMKGLATGKS